MNHMRIFSGIQPTGNLHLGNYLGAIHNWVALQEKYECIFGLMDLHAITVPQSPDSLRLATREMAAALIACGIDAKKHILFPQSSVSGHAELAWILGCLTPLGWLNRMTQFKEKAGKQKDMASLGLYGYPVLQAADILLYKATHVPVGEDQKQHLELSRDIAGAFNRAYCEASRPSEPSAREAASHGSRQEARAGDIQNGYFPLPEPMILGEATRVMSLRDGKAKMSKSDPSDYSRIHLDDDADSIAAKIRKAKSDALPGITYDPENRPESSNLLTIYAVITRRSVKEAQAEVESLQFSAFKERLAEALAAHLSPIRATYLDLMQDHTHLDAILSAGAQRARTIADKTMGEVKDMVGFYKVA